MVSYWVQYLARGPGLTSIMARDNSNSGRILAPSVYSNPIRIMAPPQAEEDYHSLHYRRPFDFTIFHRQNAMRRAFSVNKNCLTTPHLLCCTHRLTLSSQKMKTNYPLDYAFSMSRLNHPCSKSQKKNWYRYLNMNILLD